MKVEARMTRAAILLIALAAAGCKIKGRVLFVGDSNVVGSASQIVEQAYAKSHTAPTFLAVGGAAIVRNLPEWIESFTTLHQNIDGTVVNLGVNERCPLPADFAAQLDTFVANLPAGPVVWIGPTTAPPVSPCAVTVSAEVLALSKRNRNVRYLSAQTVLESLPENERFIDELHYHPAASAALYRAALDALGYGTL